MQIYSPQNLDYCILYDTGERNSQAVDGDVLTDCQWHGVLGLGELHTQRPGC